MEVNVNLESLQSFVADVFVRLGVSEAGGRAAADVLVFADRRRIRSHGVGNLDRLYVEKIRRGLIDPAASATLISEDAAVALLDGHCGLGLVVATEAMDLAVRKARACGAAVVAVRNSTHFGSSGFYSERAIAAGMIGIAMSNLGSQVIARPPDGLAPMLGTNPLSVAAPAADLPPFSLDMSTTVVSTGRIRVTGERGESCPDGWLVDDDGRDVNDPSRFFNGRAHLQMLGGEGSSGGYKGYGLALAVDVLSGLLAGAAVGPAPSRSQTHGDAGEAVRENTGHLFIAIDIERFRPLDDFRSAMDVMLGALLDSPSREGHPPVVYPGYPEARAARMMPDDCVALDAEDYGRLSRFATELSLEAPKTVGEVVSSF